MLLIQLRNYIIIVSNTRYGNALYIHQLSPPIIISTPHRKQSRGRDEEGVEEGDLGAGSAFDGGDRYLERIRAPRVCCAVGANQRRSVSLWPSPLQRSRSVVKSKGPH